uniref:Uncharacterized protein n=1 Tax=Acrobeloides nanus TaxID=290746 RepID=A0A914C7B6_9BILA
MPGSHDLVTFQGTNYTLPLSIADATSYPTTLVCDDRGQCQCPNFACCNLYITDGTSNGFDLTNLIFVCGFTSSIVCAPGKISTDACVYIGNAAGAMIAGSQIICSNSPITIQVTCNLDTTMCNPASQQFCSAPGIFTTVINGVTYTLGNPSPNRLICDTTALFFG